MQQSESESNYVPGTEYSNTLDILMDYKRRGLIPDIETQIQIENMLAQGQDPSQLIDLGQVMGQDFMTEEDETE